MDRYNEALPARSGDSLVATVGGAVYLAEQMAEFALGLDFGELPSPVVEAAARIVADTLACGVAALDEPGPAFLRQYALERAGRPARSSAYCRRNAGPGSSSAATPQASVSATIRAAASTTGDGSSPKSSPSANSAICSARYTAPPTVATRLSPERAGNASL